MFDCYYAMSYTSLASDFFMCVSVHYWGKKKKKVFYDFLGIYCKDILAVKGTEWLGSSKGIQSVYSPFSHLLWMLKIRKSFFVTLQCNFASKYCGYASSHFGLYEVIVSDSDKGTL